MPSSSMSEAPPLIEMCGVTCGYGSKVILQGVNLSVRRGEVYRFRLPKGVGHEQRGERYGVVVQADELLESPPLGLSAAADFLYESLR